MGKIFVLLVTDHEEYILSKIMEIIAAEPGFDHIVSSHPNNTLVFPGLELRLKEKTVHRNGGLISMTHREFATLVYLAKHPSWVFSAGQIYEEVWGRIVKTAERLFQVSLVRTAENSHQICRKRGISVLSWGADTSLKFRRIL